MPSPEAESSSPAAEWPSPDAEPASPNTARLSPDAESASPDTESASPDTERLSPKTSPDAPGSDHPIGLSSPDGPGKSLKTEQVVALITSILNVTFAVAPAKPTTLAALAIVPRKTPKPLSVEALAARTAKADATRKARGTTSKKQKAAIIFVEQRFELRAVALSLRPRGDRAGREERHP